MKKGFTLIELLAVIILLAIIALIATPTVINVINTAKDKADLESINGMVDSARLYYGESMMDNDKKKNIENLNDIYNDVILLNKPDNGHLYINEKGLIALSVVIRNKCYTKQFSGKIVINNDIDNCTLGYIGIDTEAPTVSFSVTDGTFNTNGWANSNFNVNITINDSQSGASSYKYCIDTTECEPTVEVDDTTGYSEINSESATNKVCLIGIDNYGNESDIICSDDYKLDKTNPTITVDNISINKNDAIDLSSNVITSDSLSGVDNYTYNPTSIDTTIAGNKMVTYTVTDKADNSTSIDRMITVITDKPSIAYSTLTSPNGNGWFNSSFYIKATATSDTSTSINNILWCSTTSSSCTPSSSVSDNNITAYMTSNSTTNKVCVQAFDTTGNSSDTICSSNYQLDSVIPTLTDKGDSITIDQGDSYQVSSYFNTPTYGISGGTLSCSPTNTSSLGTGSQTVSCTATSNSGLSTTTNKTITVNVTYFSNTEGVNIPQLTIGMTPIKWVGGVETTTTADDTDWYDYSNKLWANAKTADGSYWVWIPRYAYEITSGWHTSTTGTIDIKFLKNDTTENSSGATIYTSGYDVNGINTSNAYFLEPAFQNETGNTKYGFWVAKFETSNTTSMPKSVPNVSSLRSLTIGNMYTAAANMSTKTSYGWTSGTVDTHMMTNYEWGAVAYLTQSSYGKNSEVWINNSSTFTTGCAGSSVSASSYSGCQNAYNTVTGMNASTTGNITGIYDMSGCAYEYVAAYVNDGSSYLTTYGSNILSSSINKNIYSMGAKDTEADNYDANKNIYGDAVYEISSSYDGGTSWNGDSSYMPYSSDPWFFHGGYSASTTYTGVFNFNNNTGYATTHGSFRLVVLTLQ